MTREVEEYLERMSEPHGGDAVKERLQRVQEGRAAVAVHDRPFTHVLAAEHDSLHVAEIHDQDAAAGEQQKIDVQVAAAAVRHQHVAQ